MAEYKKRGPKPHAKPDDINTMYDVCQRAINNFDAKVINNFPELLQQWYDLAFGQGAFAKAGIKDRKSAIMELIKYTTDKYGDEAKETPNDKGDAPAEDTDELGFDNVLSMKRTK